MHIDKFEDSVDLNQLSDEYKWAIDTFPALHKYQKEHNIMNLQKLCVEVVDFCSAIFASTQNDEERAVFRKALDKLSNI